MYASSYHIFCDCSDVNYYGDVNSIVYSRFHLRVLRAYIIYDKAYISQINWSITLNVIH